MNPMTKPTTRRPFMKTTLLSLVATALGGLSLTACQPVDRGQVAAAPQWAATLQSLPPTADQSPPMAGAAASAQTEFTADSALPRGSARVLTRRIGSATPDRPNPTDDRQNSRGNRDDANRDGANRAAAPVVVNIQQHQMAAPANTEVAAVVPPAGHSPLESLYAGNISREPDRQVSQFGYDYFQRPLTAADELGPVSDDYVVGAGDELVVSVWGSLVISARPLVGRDGSIELQDIGNIPVAGRSLTDATTAIRQAIEVGRKDFELSVSIGKLRRIGVHVTGEVATAGLVEVPARSSLLTALIAAGGPKKTGSLRRIELQQGDTRTTVDLYDFLLRGDRAALVLLQPGAVISVPPIGPTAAVAGLVQRPGIYELTTPPTVQQMIDSAGGLTAFTFTPQAQIERTVNGRGRQKFDLPLTGQGLSQPMADGEILLIGAVESTNQPCVAVSGQVVRPGSYEYKPGMRVADLLAKADGLTIDAFLPQALISRQIGPGGSLQQLADRTTTASSKRVLLIDLSLASKGDPEHNLELMPLDHLEIRSVADSVPQATVSILGAVDQPGTYELTSGLRISALVAMSGNLKADAYVDAAEIVRRVYNPESRAMDIRRFTFNLEHAIRLRGDSDPVLQAGDQVIVRSLRAEQVTVSIEGEVRFPGKYVFPAGARITDMISAAGGITPTADLRAASFLRRSAQKSERDRLGHLAEQTRRTYEAALEHLVKDGHTPEGIAGKLALDQTRSLMERIEETEALGRVVIPFLQDDFPETRYNLTLEDGDRLVLPRRRETVSVVGLVFNPTSFVAESGTTVRSVIDRAGGMAEYADAGRIYVIRADGIVESMAQKSGKRLTLSSLVLPGDVVLVPREPLERSFGAQMADTLALARQAAEVAILTSRIGNITGSLDVTTVLPSAEQTGRSADYSSNILAPRRDPR